MIIEQPLAGATQYTGLAGAGLVDWNTPGSPTSALSGITLNVDETILIQTLALETTELIPTIFIRFVAPGENIATSLRRVTILQPRVPDTLTAQPTAGFAFLGCGIYVPRSVSPAVENAGMWRLVLTTLGKAADANFIVEYTKGVKPAKTPQR